MTTRLFFCGEVVADMFEPDHGSGDFKLLLGGSQFNGAMGASRAVKRENLDHVVGFVGPLSSGDIGDRFYKKLTENKIDTSGIKRVARNTTLAMVSIVPGEENKFTFYGRDTAEEMTKIEDLPTSLGKPGDKIICSLGSISTVMEPARFAWIEFARRMRNTSLLVYDLNTRPSIAKDRTRYQEIVATWAQTAHVVKASDADIKWAYPDMSMKEVAALWMSHGASMAVFTKGMEGSEAYVKGVEVSAGTPALTVRNTVGAGDNFNAGLAINLARIGCFTPEALSQCSESQLARVLQGANTTAANHLTSNNGAKPLAANCG